MSSNACQGQVSPHQAQVCGSGLHRSQGNGGRVDILVKAIIQAVQTDDCSMAGILTIWLTIWPLSDTTAIESMLHHVYAAITVNSTYIMNKCCILESPVPSWITRNNARICQWHWNMESTSTKQKQRPMKIGSVWMIAWSCSAFVQVSRQTMQQWDITRLCRKVL